MPRGKDYITSLIAQGEHEHQDFKYQISDARKIARSISAFANNSGGHLLVGVKDNGHIAGVSSDEEIYMIEQAATMYCQPQQQVHFRLYRIEGKTVLKVDVDEADEKPVKAPDDNGRWQAYYRVGDENILASSVHVKVLEHKSHEDEPPAIIHYSEREQLLLGYLRTHSGITLTGFTRLAHISRNAAELSVVNLCNMGVITLQYHNGHCLITPSPDNNINNP